MNQRQPATSPPPAAVPLPRGTPFKVFGPVLFYDLLRIARRSRYALLRVGYALFLLLMLLSVYGNLFEKAWREAVPAREMAALAESFFYTFMGIQFVAVALLTPAYTAGAVAEEKERKTLEFLLATDLRNHEIIFSKQLARLANMSLLVLTGLPILAMTQFLGGVDPVLVLLGFAATALTMLGLGSLSVLCSVYARKPRNAIMQTYLVMVAYLCLTGIAKVMLEVFPAAGAVRVWPGDDPVTLLDVANAVGTANPFLLLYRFEMVFARGQGASDIVLEFFQSYAVFYTALTLACTGWSVLRLRAVALKQASGPSKKRFRWVSRRKAIPVSDRPMVWKEVRMESGQQQSLAARVAVVILVLASLVPPVWMLVYYFDEWMTKGVSDRWLSVGMNVWVRGVGTAVACLTLLGVASRASGSITGERDKQTFDELLTTPLDSSEILYGKWLGSILSARWGLAWLALIAAVGVLTGGLHFLALPLLGIAWFVFAAFLAALGLWYSMTCRSTMRANLATLGTVFGLTCGQWCLYTSCMIPLMVTGGSGEALAHVATFQAFGLTPPVTLGFLAFHGEEFGRDNDQLTEFLTDSLVGLCLWGIAAWVLWAVASRRFRRITNRLPALPRPANPFAQAGAVAKGDGAAWVEEVPGPSPPLSPDGGA